MRGMGGEWRGRMTRMGSQQIVSAEANRHRHSTATDDTFAKASDDNREQHEPTESAG